MVLHKESKRPLLDYLLCVCVDTVINISLLISLNALYFNWVKVQNCYDIEKVKSKKEITEERLRVYMKIEQNFSAQMKEHKGNCLSRVHT